MQKDIRRTAIRSSNQTAKTQAKAHNSGIRALREEHDDDGLVKIVLRFPTNLEQKEIRFRIDELFSSSKGYLLLVANGCNLPHDQIKKEIARIAATTDRKAVRVTKRCGWHGNMLLTPYGAILPVGELGSVFLDPAAAAHPEWKPKGDIDSYLDALEPIVEQSDYLSFSYILGMVPTVMSYIDRVGGFSVCFCGDSSTGKTTSIRLAQSVFASGASESQLKNFGDTANKLVHDLPTYNGTTVCFGDIKNAPEKDRVLVEKLQTIVFNGAAAQRRRGMTSTTEAPVSGYFVYLLSAEKSLSSLWAMSGAELEDGDRFRLIGVPVSSQVEGGIFCGSPAGERNRLIRNLEQLLNQHQGTAIRRLHAHLVDKGRDAISKRVDQIETRFLRQYADYQPKQMRLARTFAIIAATAGVASDADLLPLDRKHFDGAIKRMFQLALGAIVDPKVDKDLIIHRVLEMLLNKSCFPKVKKSEKPVNIAACNLGFQRKGPSGPSVYVKKKAFAASLSPKEKLVFREVWERLNSIGAIRLTDGRALGVHVQQEGLGREKYHELYANKIRNLISELD